MKTLQSILFPYPLQQFLDQNWTQQAVYIPNPTREKFRSLFGWQDLNYLLNYHRIDDPNLRFSLDGKSLPPTAREGWRDRLQQGATLVINSVDELVPAVSELANALRIEIGHSAQVNLYCSPERIRGFDNHYDTHDVLILQIDGEKDWFVFKDTVPYPIVDHQTLGALPPDQPPYLECTLKSGDVLYIPRGHWHYAIAKNQPSLHLTVGIHGQTGIDWLIWLMGELQNEPEWRQNLPFISSSINSEKSLENSLKNIQYQLQSYLKQPDLAQRYQEYLRNQVQPSVPFALPTQLGFDIFNNGLETRFICPQTQSLDIKNLGDRYHQITKAGKQIKLKGIPDQVFPKLFDEHGFSILEMADWAPDLDLDADVVPLLTLLVKEGILLVKD